LVEVGLSGFNYAKQFLQSLATPNGRSALSFIDEGSDNADVVSGGVKGDCGDLIGD
jgi:hypothetical protein